MNDTGHKNDAGKARMDLISPFVLLEVGEVLTQGAEKYGDYNWQKVGAEHFYAAAQRHLNKFWAGENLAEDSGHSHLVHAITNLMFIYELTGYPKQPKSIQE